MPFSPVSFLLGMGAATLLPALSRVVRPVAVEVTAAALGMIADGRRLIAEQLEALEDVAAEARARREELDLQAAAVTLDDSGEEHVEPDEPDERDEPDAEPVTATRSTRRANGSGRRRAS